MTISTYQEIIALRCAEAQIQTKIMTIRAIRALHRDLGLSDQFTRRSAGQKRRWAKFKETV